MGPLDTGPGKCLRGSPQTIPSPPEAERTGLSLCPPCVAPTSEDSLVVPVHPAMLPFGPSQPAPFCKWGHRGIHIPGHNWHDPRCCDSAPSEAQCSSQGTWGQGVGWQAVPPRPSSPEAGCWHRPPQRCPGPAGCAPGGHNRLGTSERNAAALCHHLWQRAGSQGAPKAACTSKPRTRRREVGADLAGHIPHSATQMSELFCHSPAQSSRHAEPGHIAVEGL